MDRFANLIDVSRLRSLSGVGEAFRDPRGLFALLALVVLVLYGLSVGKTKALVSLLSVYVAYVLTVLFPFLDEVVFRAPAIIRPAAAAALFLGLYIATFLVLSRAMAKGRFTLGELSVARVVLISVVQLGLIASITTSLLPPELAAAGFGPLLPALGNPYALWAWAVGSLAILPFMRVRARD